MERAALSAAQLDAVELLGGGSRIPAVQAAVSGALGGRTLDKCALGCTGSQQQAAGRFQ